MEKTKKCGRCKKEKPLTEFWRNHNTKDGKNYVCKTCETKRHLAYVRAHKEKINEYMKKTRSTEEGRKRARELCRQTYKRHKSTYLRQQIINRARKAQNDPVYKRKQQLVRALSALIHQNLPYRIEGQKTVGLERLLGCTPEYLRKYLFSTWEKNYKKPWSGEPFHIDHIIPLCTAKTIKDVEKLFHYKNLQLLTPFDNEHKNTSIPTKS